MMIKKLHFDIETTGKYAGIRRLFIELPTQSDLHFCFSVDFSLDDFRKFILSEPTRLAVISGKEALINKDLMVIVEVLKSHKYSIACRTSGAYPPYKGIDYVVCSPSKDASPAYSINRELWPMVKEFNYEVDANFDFSILDRHDVKDGRRYSLTPDVRGKDFIMDKIGEFIKQNPRWILTLPMDMESHDKINP